jgi:aerobic-type carbon monoxide dehydrogenase small subunit (CoxS/CutS family)
MELKINGKTVAIDAADDTPLLWALRDELDMTGTKYGCGKALCGACTVHVDGVPTRSCALPIAAAAGKAITTIEGVASDAATGKVATIVQAAWTRHSVPQCGYCQSGQVMAATALLAANAKPSDADIDAAMSGNICRCGTYQRIRAAIHAAADDLAKG